MKKVKRKRGAPKKIETLDKKVSLRLDRNLQRRIMLVAKARHRGKMAPAIREVLETGLSHTTI